MWSTLAAASLLRPKLGQKQNDLAMIYVSGDGVPKDFAKALKWFRKAAEHGGAIFMVSSWRGSGRTRERKLTHPYVATTLPARMSGAR